MPGHARRWWSRIILALFIAMTFGDAISDIVQDNDPDDWIPEQHLAAAVEHLHASLSEAVRPPEALPAEVDEARSNAKRRPRLDAPAPTSFKAGVDPPPVNRA